MDLLLEVKQERKMYAQWKQGQVTSEEYRDAACHWQGEDSCGQRSTRIENQPEMWATIKRCLFEYWQKAGQKNHRPVIG